MWLHNACMLWLHHSQAAGWAHFTVGPKDCASSATAASLPSWEMRRGNLVLQGSRGLLFFSIS